MTWIKAFTTNPVYLDWIPRTKKWKELQQMVLWHLCLCYGMVALICIYRQINKDKVIKRTCILISYYCFQPLENLILYKYNINNDHPLICYHANIMGEKLSMKETSNYLKIGEKSQTKNTCNKENISALFKKTSFSSLRTR